MSESVRWTEYHCLGCDRRVTIDTAATMPNPMICPDCGGGRWTVHPSTLEGRIAKAREDVRARGGVWSREDFEAGA